MNATQSNTMDRTAFNAALLASATPSLVGSYDADKGLSDQSHDRYTKDGDIAEYREGYMDTVKARGRADYFTGAYNPPSPCDAQAYDAYIRAYNDAWAAHTNRTSWFMAR